jgi:hypothetical protein
MWTEQQLDRNIPLPLQGWGKAPVNNDVLHYRLSHEWIGSIPTPCNREGCLVCSSKQER